MATPDELQAALKVGREAVARALASVESNWEKSPEAGGQEAWSARQAAEHVIGSELFFAGETCKACGYDGPDSPFSGPLELTSPTEAAAAFDLAVQAANSKQKYVTAEDLERPHDQMGSVEGIMTIQVWHLINHALQIRSAATS